MQCPDCLRDITEASRFCPHCGRRLAAADAPDTAASDVTAEFCRLRAVEANLRKEIDALSLHLRSIEAKLRVSPPCRDEPSIQPLRADSDREFEFMAEPAGEVKPVSPPPPPGKSVIPETRAAPGGHLRRPPPTITAGGETPGHAKKSFDEIRFGQKWLLIVGIVVMVFGVGYFLKYSFEQGWVGPVGRVTMAYLWGMGLLFGGKAYTKRKKDNFGLFLIGGAIAILYFATYAGFGVYHLFDHLSAFVVMLTITATAAVLAIHHDEKYLAVLATFGGFLTPLILSTGRDNQIGLMSYMLLLNLGILAVAFHKRWKLLNTLGFAFTLLLFSAWMIEYYGKDKFLPTIVFANAFYLIYVVVPFAYDLRGLDEDKKRGGYLICLVDSFYFFLLGAGLIYDIYGPGWASLPAVAYSFVFMSLSAYLSRRGKQDGTPFIVYLASSALFLTIAVPLLFSKQRITDFWALQSFVMLLIALKLNRPKLKIAAYLLLTLVIFMFFFYTYPDVFRYSYDSYAFSSGFAHLLPDRFFSCILLMLAMYASMRLVKGRLLPLPQEALSPGGREGKLLAAAFGTCLFLVLTMETSGFFQTYMSAARHAAISVLWTLFSVFLVIRGFRDKSPTLRMVSFALFGLTLLKVFLVDSSKVGTPYRILSFIVLGLVLVASSYLYYRFRDRIGLSGDRREDEKA